MYVQLQMKLSSSTCTSDSTAWPIFWLNPLEFFTGAVSQFTEVDGFECYLGGQNYMNVHYWDMIIDIVPI